MEVTAKVVEDGGEGNENLVKTHDSWMDTDEGGMYHLPQVQITYVSSR